jgi:hypothetical protein
MIDILIAALRASATALAGGKSLRTFCAKGVVRCRMRLPVVGDS